MGIIKGIAWFVTGGAVRPTTTRERSRMYQRQANQLLEQQLDAMQDTARQPQTIPVPTDSRPRGTCPACLEMMLVGASTCPHCHTTGITWPKNTNQINNNEPPSQQELPPTSNYVERAHLRAIEKAALKEHRARMAVQSHARKAKRDDLEESLARLEILTDKAFSLELNHQSRSGPNPPAEVTDLEKSLVAAFAEVHRCLDECRGHLSLAQIGHHQEALYTLKVQISEIFDSNND